MSLITLLNTGNLFNLDFSPTLDINVNPQLNINLTPTLDVSIDPEYAVDLSKDSHISCPPQSNKLPAFKEESAYPEYDSSQYPIYQPEHQPNTSDQSLRKSFIKGLFDNYGDAKDTLSFLSTNLG